MSRAQEPYPNRVPPLVSVCYRNEFSDRYSRMPHSMDNLIALIRKIEAHEDTALWSSAKMATTLLRRYSIANTLSSVFIKELNSQYLNEENTIFLDLGKMFRYIVVC